MPPAPLSRRSFLVAAGGVLILAACGTGDGEGAEPQAGDGESGDHHAPVPGGPGLSALVLASDLYATAGPQRFAFALADDGDYASGPPATIALGPDGDEPGEPTRATLHAAGLPPERGIYTVPATFPEPGTWAGVVEASGDRAELVFDVQPRAGAPVPGQAAPAGPSPTVTNPLGVDPLCTRDPQCSLHDVSLDSLVGTGRPVAVLFATPARCQSQYCGPVLDELLTQVDGYRDRVAFVHVEIYRADTGVDLVPTVETWNLPSEPWLFGVDTSGTVVARLDGAFGADEIGALLEGIA